MSRRLGSSSSFRVFVCDGPFGGTEADPPGVVDRRRSAAAGFDDHLAKPVDMESLLGMVAGLRKPARAADGIPA